MEELIKKFYTLDPYRGYKDSCDCGYGCGIGDGYGSSRKYGYSDNISGRSGFKDSSGYGFGSGSCNGDGDDYTIAYINGDRIYYIDGLPTVITSVRDNVAMGVIFNKDFTFTPCYIVKENGEFAHGSTLHEASLSLQEKLYDDSTDEERLEAFKRKFPEYDTPYSNADLYVYHHVLTGSCRLGRDNFREQHGLTMEGTMTVREFVELTKGEYGGDIVKRLSEIYGK